ncbi:hypothetical protein E2C01_023151 [Portunus trituberculatus]|uniref:Uncharacterized protein n=1 Tax=Portunus trituberculatus TaxID=210409 RepID=A0A5B7E8Z4_PORTR|nr:hypothetical protein [Portunus trituberculatus]
MWQGAPAADPPFSSLCSPRCSLNAPAASCTCSSVTFLGQQLTRNVGKRSSNKRELDTVNIPNLWLRVH